MFKTLIIFKITDIVLNKTEPRLNMVKIYIILDGISDRPCKILNGLTPLQAAKTKNLDYFSINSNHGYVYAINEHITPKSEEALIALLGYNPKEYYYSRGPIEAYGSNINFEDFDLALKANFATVDKDGKRIVDRRVGRILTTREAKELEESINEIKLELPFKFKSTIGYSGVLIFKGELSANISNVDPAYKKVGKFGIGVNSTNNIIQQSIALDPDKRTKLSARLINEFTNKSYEILINHKINLERRKKYLLEANIIITRDAGIDLPFLEKKIGWCAIVNTPLEIGIAKLIRMNIINSGYPEIKSKDVYHNLHKCIKIKIKEIIKNIKEAKYEKYFIHFKELDIAGHDNKPEEKKKMIELIDKKLFKFLRKLSKKKEIELVITGGYSTPCELKTHTNDHVPLMHYCKDKNDLIERFNEESCLEGFYGKIYGKDVLKKVGFE